MAWTRALFSLILFGPAAAFVTPSSTGKVLAPHGRTQAGSEVAPLYKAVIARPEGKFDDAARNIAIGVMLGFFVGFSALAAPASAFKGECIRQEGCKGEAEEAAAKKKFAQVDSGDPKPNRFSIPSTGGGRYRFYGLDATAPIPSIPQTTDGTYIDNSQTKLELIRAQQKAFRERVEPLLGKSPNTTTYSPYNAYPPRTTGFAGLDGLKINTNVTEK